MLDANGTLLSEQRYLPFGQPRASTGPLTQTDFGYTGQRDLDGTGLMDYKARFYDGSLGKFIQPDSIVSNPLNPQTWNRYAYVSNNPVRYNDPKRACPPPVYFLKILALAESRSRTPIPRWKAMA